MTQRKRPNRPAAHRPVTFVEPMLATLVKEPFDRDDWIFEIKWDGYRAIADIEDGKVALYSRRQQSFNDAFVPIFDALGQLGHDAVLDGEIVMLDAQGMPSFQMLQNYRKVGEADGHLVYYLFDLLSLDGSDLRAQPLSRRKEALAALFMPSERLRISDHVEREGLALFRVMIDQGMEGMIAKNRKSPYRESVRSFDWLKIKTRHRQEAVIAGFTKPRGARQNFGALILGVYDGDHLNYIGHTGGGFDAKRLADLHQKLKTRTRTECPFAAKPKTNAPATWVRPDLVCEIAFHGWTADGVMRQPIFVGLRTDKRPIDVHREIPAAAQKSQKGRPLLETAVRR